MPVLAPQFQPARAVSGVARKRAKGFAASRSATCLSASSTAKAACELDAGIAVFSLPVWMLLCGSRR